ncbi:MAG: insulinase family protein [Gemmatimonadota bacterium]|nr:insulinase family protein [Gemmatimonadota bacterium]MDH3421480.1 insulinase family protein [Gemmatimonadota bacterium]
MSAFDRTSPPPSGSIRDFDFPKVDRRRLSNGLDLRVARVARLPVVSVRLFMRSGESALGVDSAGLCVLTANSLDGGTQKRSGTELAESLERIGARFGANGGWEGTSASLYCLADRLAEALPLLAEAVVEPGFPDDEVARAKDQHLAGLRQQKMDPGSLAHDAALARYFAEGVPYARPDDGTEQTIAGVTADHLRGYADANYRPENGGLIVVGDVDTAEVVELAERCFSGWTGSPASVADFEVTPAARERRVLVVHRPGAVQSEVRVGHVGTHRLTPDYFALSVANMVLGGTFTSRLNLNLRERNGFTYGVRSRFGFRSQPGPFEVATAVGNEVTPAAVREILNELEGIASRGPTEDEVASARDFAAGIFGLQLETVGQIASRASQLVVFGLAEDYYHEYRNRMRAVTTEGAAEAAGRHMRPNEAQVVVVGDADVVGPPLEALGLGPFEVTREQPGA